jgi:outer membrane protein OmpA-like peptidoglycan-associated protein
MLGTTKKVKFGWGLVLTYPCLYSIPVDTVSKGHKKMPNIKSLVIIILSFPPLLWAATPCKQANSLVNMAYSQQSAQKKATLKRALVLCPTHARAHNNLAVAFENEDDYPQALFHYEKTLKHGNQFTANYARLGLGDVYYKQGQWPLSLKNYLQICGYSTHVSQRVAALLKDNRYRTVENNQIMMAKSLGLILNKDSLDDLYKQAVLCQQQQGEKGGVSIKATKAFRFNKFIFRNFRFKTGEASLSLISLRQLDEMAKTFKTKVKKGQVRIGGHTDAQCPRGTTVQSECDHFNNILSEKRADVVKQALIQRGVPLERIQAKGYGSSSPLDSAVLAKNRRVEIEVKWKKRWNK